MNCARSSLDQSLVCSWISLPTQPYLESERLLLLQQVHVHFHDWLLNNRAKVAHLVTSWGTLKRVPHGSTQVTAQPNLHAQSRPKSHYTKRKVVKEREKKGRLNFQDLKQYVRKLEAHLKHQRVFSSGL